MTIRTAGTNTPRLANAPSIARRPVSLMAAASLLLWAAACGSDSAAPASDTAVAGGPAGAAGQSAAPATPPTATPPVVPPTNTVKPPTATNSGAPTAPSAGGSAPAPGGASASAGSAAPAPGGMTPTAPGAMTPTAPAAPAGETVPTLYWLDITGSRVYRSIDFADGEAIVMRTGTAPDGVAVDLAGGKIYWTNMGNLLGTGGGTLQRANLDGTGVETIVPAGVATTPKQMTIDLTNKKIYWGDREGAKLWRAEMDGSSPEAIVSGHGLTEVVGVTLDVPMGKVYFTDRLGRKILRTNIEMPAGQTGADRMDVEEMLVQTGSATPIDLDIDHDKRILYWTDRQIGTVHSMGLEIPAGETAATRSDVKTLIDGLTEPIGMSLDIKNNKMYFTELSGGVSEASLDGSNVKRGFLGGSSSGVAIVHVPK